MDTGFIQFIADRLAELWLRTGEHLILIGFSAGMAVIIGIPLGILASRYTKIRGALLGFVGILQTLPSLAMLAILLALLQKIGTVPAIIALTLYALLPIVRNTIAGIEGVSNEVIEAARGIGMTRRQQLRMIKMPLALPVIVAGIRTAGVVGVGIATLSAFIGAGGLGQFINRGLALSNTRLILLGAVPAALLALIVDFSIGAAAWAMRPIRQKEKKTLKGKLRPLALFLPLVLVIVGIIAYLTKPSQATFNKQEDAQKKETICIGTKNFTEQFILGELMAQLIECKTNLEVRRYFNLGGTMICHKALINGEIDLYAEYTGTGLTAILNRQYISNPKKVYQIISRAYLDKFNVKWLQPFGFNNTYVITVSQEDAKRYGWEKISDLASEASHLSAGFTSEFVEREDGYPRLVHSYGFNFHDVKDFDPSLMYEAISREEVDIICAFATDGRIAAYNLVTLEDDKNIFPPYEAAPVIRMETLKKHREIRTALEPLLGLLSKESMQMLNYEVDKKNRNYKKVASEFLKSKNLIK